MKVVKLNCPQCNAYLEVNPEDESVICKYCGANVVIENENITKTEKIINFVGKKYKNILEYRNSDEYKKRERQKLKEVGIIYLILFLVFCFLFVIISIFSEKDPKLSDYNDLSLGMTYEQCKDKLGSDGHLIVEEDNKTVFVWYSVNCKEVECPTIIELEFDDNKLIRRNEKNLK